MAETYDVCVITTIHPPFDGRIYQKEVLAYVDAGFRVALVSPWEVESPPGGIEWITVHPSGSRIGRVFHAVRVLRSAFRVSAKCYHFHDLDFLPAAVLLRALKRVPTVYDCHENYPEEILYNKPWIPRRIRRPVAGLVRVLENLAVRYLRHVIVVVPNLAIRFERLGADVAMVRNFPSWEVQPELRHDHAVICTGSMSVANGALVLLDVARELKRKKPDLPMIVADRFQNENLKTHFLSTVASEGLFVRIVPKVHPTEMDRLLRQGCVGLSVEQAVPNMQLGYHTKLFEYMAFGLPVVSSDIQSNRHLLTEARAGILVAPDDAEGFASAIVRLVDDGNLLAEERRKGFDAVRKTFNWHNEKHAMLRFVGSLIGNKYYGEST